MTGLAPEPDRTGAPRGARPQATRSCEPFNRMPSPPRVVMHVRPPVVEVGLPHVSVTRPWVSTRHDRPRTKLRRGFGAGRGWKRDTSSPEDGAPCSRRLASSPCTPPPSSSSSRSVGGTGPVEGEAADISRRRPRSPVDAPSPGPQVLVIDVSGEVRRAGVYRLPAGARVLDAVRKARAGRRADLDALNLAARLDRRRADRRAAPRAPVRRRPPVPAARLRRRRSRSTLRRSSSSRPSTGSAPRSGSASSTTARSTAAFARSPSSTR